jgi:hypothetical protein
MSAGFTSYTVQIIPIYFRWNLLTTAIWLVFFDLIILGKVSFVKPWLMRSIGLWWYYINTTITILDIIHCPVFYLKLYLTLYPYMTGNTLRLCYEPNRLILSIVLRWWYINVTITILDIIHCPVFYLKQDVSETEFCLCLQVEPTQPQ